MCGSDFNPEMSFVKEALLKILYKNFINGNDSPPFINFIKKHVLLQKSVPKVTALDYEVEER